jgi:hypothetical protein
LALAPHTALGGVADTTEGCVPTLADGAACRTADEVGIEHLRKSDGALRIEACTVTADAVPAGGTAGQFLGTADLLLDERSLSEDPDQADRAIGAALAIAALQRLITAVEPADHIPIAERAVTADGLIA